ncbi:hypothetical protein EVAR_6598_1 [Eumeta japonica]|uniref:Uncharacterized protein n=1 Tax=Eumeta variegata TaxID=151549 RepID=A0A4C1TN37_EUMVA|nr:hypothetical protein EVAR_6598_1 [Eumeta japonica]
MRRRCPKDNLKDVWFIYNLLAIARDSARVDIKIIPSTRSRSLFRSRFDSDSGSVLDCIAGEVQIIAYVAVYNKRPGGRKGINSIVKAVKAEAQSRLWFEESTRRYVNFDGQGRVGATPRPTSAISSPASPEKKQTTCGGGCAGGARAATGAHCTGSARRGPQSVRTAKDKTGKVLTYLIRLENATTLEVENIILGDSQDDSADNEEDSDVCSNEVDSSDDSESSLESDYE